MKDEKEVLKTIFNAVNDIKLCYEGISIPRIKCEEIKKSLYHVCHDKLNDLAIEKRVQIIDKASSKLVSDWLIECKIPDVYDGVAILTTKPSYLAVIALNRVLLSYSYGNTSTYIHKK
jgi:hypothetical protein